MEWSNCPSSILVNGAYVILIALQKRSWLYPSIVWMALENFLSFWYSGDWIENPDIWWRIRSPYVYVILVAINLLCIILMIFRVVRRSRSANHQSRKEA